MTFAELVYAAGATFVVSFMTSVLCISMYDNTDQLAYYKGFTYAGRCQIHPSIDGDLEQFLVNGSASTYNMTHSQHTHLTASTLFGVTACDFSFGSVCPGLIGLRLPVVMYIDTGFETLFCEHLVLRTRHEFSESELRDAKDLLLQLEHDSPSIQCRTTQIRGHVVILDEGLPGWDSIVYRGGCLSFALWTIMGLCYLLGVFDIAPFDDEEGASRESETDDAGDGFGK